MAEKTKTAVLTRGVPRALVVIALLVVILWGAAAARTFLIPVCIAALLAFLMAPMVTFLRRWLPELVAITITAIVLVLPFLLIGYLLGHEVRMLVRDFPKMRAWFDQALLTFAHSPLGEKLDFPEYLDLSGVGEKVMGSIGESAQVALRGLQTLLEFGSHLVLVLLFAVVMLATRAHLGRTLAQILDRFEGPKNHIVLDEVVMLIERFLIARLVIVLVAGTLGTLALLIFRVPYTLVLGMWMGLGTLVPVVGFLSGVIASIAVALATGHSLTTVIGLIVTLAAVGVLESHILTPKYIGTRLNINVLFTFLGLFAGELLWGVWGMFLSIPFLGILRIALSASANLKPWAELLAEREDHGFQERLARRKRAD